MIRRATFLIGSAKPPGASTSESLARYLLERLDGGGVCSSLLFVTRAGGYPDEERLLLSLAEADLFVLAAPLYVDGLPYLVTRTLETIAAARQRTSSSRPCAFTAILNCGFPEAQQCATALEIARLFARDAGFQWAGGLALGGGGAIDGRPLRETRLTRHVRAALDLAAAGLLSDSAIPEKAVTLMAKPMMSSRLYIWIASYRWKRQARHHGVRHQLSATPFRF